MTVNQRESSGFLKESDRRCKYVKKSNGDVSWHCGIVMV